MQAMLSAPRSRFALSGIGHPQNIGPPSGSHPPFWLTFCCNTHIKWQPNLCNIWLLLFIFFGGETFRRKEIHMIMSEWEFVLSVYIFSAVIVLFIGKFSPDLLDSSRMKCFPWPFLGNRHFNINLFAINPSPLYRRPEKS